MINHYMITVQNEDENFLENMTYTPRHKKTYEPETKLYTFKIKRTTSGKINVRTESKKIYRSSLVSIESLD